MAVSDRDSPIIGRAALPLVTAFSACSHPQVLPGCLFIRFSRANALLRDCTLYVDVLLFHRYLVTGSTFLFPVMMSARWLIRHYVW